MDIPVHIDQLVFGGQGFGKSQNRVVFAWNALPGEDVTVRVTRKNRKMLEGIAEQVHVASPDRIAPREEHYLSCSPWQIMPFAVENEWKKRIALETYQRIGGFVPDSLECVTDGVEYGYRNKMEFSFFQERDSAAPAPVQLAFFERGQHRKVALESCKLAHPAINETANRILQWIREQHIPIRSLKSLIIRSNRNGDTIAGLFIKDRLPFTNFPVRGDAKNGAAAWRGFHVFLSNFRSPAAVIDDTLYTDGATSITETVNGARLQYGLSSFFQVNVPVFETALADMAAAIPQGSHVVDYYSGVGAISMALRNRIARAELVDNNAEGIAFAKQNIAANGLQDFFAECIPAEKMTTLVTPEAIVIVDPPRAGLHEDVTRALLHTQPQRIIYLSCNLSTQARDLQRLSAAYRVSSTRLYNFFPRTPHIEGLCLFDRIAP